jgi:hypothetical protein
MCKWMRASLSAAVVVIGAAASLLGPLGAPAPAAADPTPCYAQFPPAPVLPPWGYHTGAPLLSRQGWFSLAWGNIDLDRGWIDGRICQAHYVNRREQLVMMEPLSPLLYHSHVQVRWGYPGNEIIAHLRVVSSTDVACHIGSVGELIMFASYNNVHSDSIQYRFSSSCREEDHLYHGPQVVAQVPPL